MKYDDLAWTVEQACLNAWPSPRQVMMGPWLVRAAGGPSRRINSINPLRAEGLDVEAILAPAEPIYQALGQPVIVRVPALVAGLDEPLARRGFEAQAETCTLFTPLDNAPTGLPATLEFSAEPSPGWFAVRSGLSGGDPVADRVIRAVTGALILPRVFVGVRSADRIAAIALGVLDRGLLVIESVGTVASARGRGLGRTAVEGVLAWGRRQSAWGACLQVLASNDPARRLYDRVGFHTHLYRYTYRCRERIG